MKEQYQKELSQVHVPAELLEKTKKAMKEEEEKLSLEKSGKIIPFKRISVAAAAVLLVIMIPVAAGALNNTNSQGNNDMQMHLAEQEDVQLQTITQEKNWFEELVDAIKELFD